MQSLIAQWRPLLHPMLVHFPIALLFASVALDWLGYWFKLANLTRAGFYTLVLGAMGAGLSALTGPDHAVGDPSVPLLLASHQTFASLTVALAVALVAIRFLAARGIGGWGALVYLGATIFLVVFVSFTGYYGGEMAYHHAVGIDAPNVTQVSGSSEPFVRALLPAKPISALLGFLCILGLGFWLFLGRAVFPRFAEVWWRAVRQEWTSSTAPLWTLQRTFSLGGIVPQSRGTTSRQPTPPSGFGHPAAPSGYAPSAPYGRPPAQRPAQPPQPQPSPGQARYNPQYAPDNQPRS